MSRDVPICLKLTAATPRSKALPDKEAVPLIFLDTGPYPLKSIEQRKRTLISAPILMIFDCINRVLLIAQPGTE